MQGASSRLVPIEGCWHMARPLKASCSLLVLNECSGFDIGMVCRAPLDPQAAALEAAKQALAARQVNKRECKITSTERSKYTEMKWKK